MRSLTSLKRWATGAVFAAVAIHNLPQVFAQPNEPIRIRGVHYGGTGCPGNSVDTYVSPDASAMTLIFDQYVAEVGPGISASASRKFCNLVVDMVVPSGWQFSVFQVDYRGFADLKSATTGYMNSSYYFSGSDARTNTRTTTARFSGPIAGKLHQVR